nr:hypothetical protein BaRGS_023155 [Batillaria attramentaria]
MMNATGTTLAELLSLQDMLTDLMEKHEYDWEPVLDMLNENYLGAGVIVRSLYDEMSMMGELFSKDSPLLQLVSYSTTYAPELVKAVMDMGNNGKIDMLGAAVDVAMKSLEGMSEDSLHNVLLLNEMLDMYPPEIRNMVGLAAGAYLEFIDVLKRIILNPDQLLQKFLSGNAQDPSCGGTTLTSYLDLAPDSSFGQLEETVCTTNWTALAMEMGNMQPEVQRISENIAVLMADLSENKIDPEVNWTQVVDNMFFSYDKLSHQLANMTWPSNFDLSPFNMSAIDMKWKEFVEDMDQLQQLDTDSLMKVLSDLQNIIFSNTTGMLGMAEDGNTFLSLLQAESYMSYHFLVFANKQLQYINSTTEVNILDMLGSNELRKAAEVLRYSPEINTIGVNTLIRLFSTGFNRIITEPDQFMSLCSNLTLFSWVVAADDSVINTALFSRLCAT